MSGLMWLEMSVNRNFRIASKSVLDKSDEELRAELLKRLVRQRLMGTTQQILEHHNPSKLPMRELPHNTVANLYLMYVAQCRATKLQPASRTTFYQVHSKWRACLRFHKVTTHSICMVCAQLKASIHAAKELWAS